MVTTTPGQAPFKRKLISRPSNRSEPPHRRASTAPPAKRLKSSLGIASTSELNTQSSGFRSTTSPNTESSHARVITPPPPVSTVADTPLRQSSSSRPQSRPTQSQQSSRSQTMAHTLPASVADDAHQRTTSLERGTMKREDMEDLLRKEIDLAVYEYPAFATEFLKIPETRRQFILNELSSRDLFRHGGNEWSVDCSQLETTEDAATHDTAARILETISRVVFIPDQFRPAYQEIVPLNNQSVRADDPNDSNTVPDIIQACPGPAGTRHWADVEFFAECKGTSKVIRPEDQMSRALLQLARYARATLVHQIHRHYVFSIAICGAKAVFVRLGRAGILHSPPIDLRTDFQVFALAAAGLFALDAKSFGYDTRFYFWPALTGRPDDHATPKELRVKTGGRRWTVLEIICQRKCLVGRATLILLLSRIVKHTQRAVLKSIWRDESRTDEGENLAAFAGYHGICQCRWSQSGDSTAVRDKASLSPSPLMKSFYPLLPKKKVNTLRSSVSATSDTSSRSLSSKIGWAKHKQYRAAPPEDRVHGMILMDEGFALWRIKRLPHVFRVFRDGLVGLAGIAEHGKVHRDVSEGNILCSPLRVPLADREDDIACTSSPNTEIPDEDTEVGMNMTDATQHFDQRSVLSSDMTVDKLNDPPLDPEDGIILVETYEEYVRQRYKGPTCYGRLYDLEFTVKQSRPDDEVRRMVRTGTPAFISAQLLLATDKRPVKHTYLHDLESFFWVLIWMIATHTEPGKELTEEALQLIDDLCDGNDRSLGLFKRSFILTPKVARGTINSLDNGWGKARTIVLKFAEFLKQNIYDKEGDQSVDSENEDPTPLDDKVACSDVEPWPVIKAVIDIFDAQISQLVES